MPNPQRRKRVGETNRYVAESFGIGFQLSLPLAGVSRSRLSIDFETMSISYTKADRLQPSISATCWREDEDPDCLSVHKAVQATYGYQIMI